MTEYMKQSEFKEELSQKAYLADDAIRRIFSSQPDIEPRLRETMQYTLGAGGKRIRAAVIMWSCEAVAGVLNEDAKYAAAAMEMVHCYSLVHDDLPAMDNDDMRRGQPTVHKKWDEATAILAGDSLATLPYEVLSTKVTDPKVAVKLIEILATVSGPSGMIAGQMADLMAEKTQFTPEMLEYIHVNKTAKMFSGAAAMGAACGGADAETLQAFAAYGLKIGLGFQVADDILDVTGSTEELGKTAGKDVEQEKATYPKLFGLERSKEVLQKLSSQAVESLGSIGEKANILRHLAVYLAERKN